MIPFVSYTSICYLNKGETKFRKNKVLIVQFLYLKKFYLFNRRIMARVSGPHMDIFQL